MSHSMPSHLIPSPAPRQRSTSQHRGAEHTRTRNTEESTCGSACSQTRTSVSSPPFLVCSSPRDVDMKTFGKTPVSQVGWALLLRSGLCTSASVARVTNAWFGRPCSFLRSCPAAGEGLGSTRTIYTWMRIVLGLVVWWLMVVMVFLVGVATYKSAGAPSPKPDTFQDRRPCDSRIRCWILNHPETRPTNRAFRNVKRMNTKSRQWHYILVELLFTSPCRRVAWRKERRSCHTVCV